MSEWLDLLAPALLGLPLLLALLELVRGAETRPSGRHPWAIVAFGVAALSCALAPLLVSETFGFAPLHLRWVPSLGLELHWRLTPAAAAVLAASAWGWAHAVRDADRSRALSGHLLTFGLTLALGSGDLISSFLSLLAMVGAGWLLSREGRGLGFVVALAASVTLCVTVGMATRVAHHAHWTVSYAELAGYVFSAGVQEQSLLLLLIAVAPFVGLFPFGGGTERIAESVGPRAAVHWRTVPALVGWALWARGIRVLAPHVAAQWTAGLILVFAGAAALRLLLLRARVARDEVEATPSAGRLMFSPLAMSAALLVTGTAWGAYALWIAMMGHIAYQVLELRPSTMSRYLRSGAPGSVFLAAFVATWAAMREAVATLHIDQAMGLGLALGSVWLLALPLVAAARGPEQAPAATRSWRVAVGVSLVLGLIPGVLVQRVAPLEEVRAQEYSFMRCAQYELRDLRRPRLLSEMSLGCANPERELWRGFDPERAESEAEPETTTTEFFSTPPQEEGAP